MGAPLGDLLLNETVYGMAKPKFERLSEKEQLEKGISGVNAEVRDALYDHLRGSTGRLCLRSRPVLPPQGSTAEMMRQSSNQKQQAA